MTSPTQILTAFDAALRETRAAITAHEKERAGLADYRAARAAETQAEVKRREALIEDLRMREQRARDAMQRARAALDALMKGVEEGTVELPPLTPLAEGEAAAATEAMERASDTLEQVQAQLT